MIAWIIIAIIAYLFIFGIVVVWYDETMNDFSLALLGALVWPLTLPVALGIAFWEWWS